MPDTSKPPGLRPPPDAEDGDEFLLQRTRPDGTKEYMLATWRPGPRRRPIDKTLTRGSDLLAEGWRIADA